MDRRFLLVVAAVAALAFSAGTQAANLAAGKAKAAEVCAACHGADGNSASPDFPKLAGQHRDYLEKALRDYKSGARKNPIMAGFAGDAHQGRHRKSRRVLRGATGGSVGEILNARSLHGEGACGRLFSSLEEVGQGFRSGVIRGTLSRKIRLELGRDRRLGGVFAEPT